MGAEAVLNQAVDKQSATLVELGIEVINNGAKASLKSFDPEIDADLPFEGKAAADWLKVDFKAKFEIFFVYEKEKRFGNAVGDLPDVKGVDDINALFAKVRKEEREKFKTDHDILDEVDEGRLGTFERKKAVAATLFECTPCKTSGSIVCPGCVGAGSFNCKTCGAKGKHQCTGCNGHGILTCGRCDGNGEHNCGSCGGHGQYRCDVFDCFNGGTICGHCRGSGRVYAADGQYIDCQLCLYHFPRGRVTCIRCRGAAWLTCGNCSGDAIVDCQTCSGYGNLTCNACGGTREQTCKNCSGKTRLTCKQCNGNKSLKCSTCDGKGRYTELHTNVVKHTVGIEIVSDLPDWEKANIKSWAEAGWPTLKDELETVTIRAVGKGSRTNTQPNGFKSDIPFEVLIARVDAKGRFGPYAGDGTALLIGKQPPVKVGHILEEALSAVVKKVIDFDGPIKERLALVKKHPPLRYIANEAEKAGLRGRHMEAINGHYGNEASSGLPRSSLYALYEALETAVDLHKESIASRLSFVTMAVGFGLLYALQYFGFQSWLSGLWGPAWTATIFFLIGLGASELCSIASKSLKSAMDGLAVPVVKLRGLARITTLGFGVLYASMAYFGIGLLPI